MDGDLIHRSHSLLLQPETTTSIREREVLFLHLTMMKSCRFRDRIVNESFLIVTGHLPEGSPGGQWAESALTLMYKS
jgi:hypothetical protein